MNKRIVTRPDAVTESAIVDRHTAYQAKTLKVVVCIDVETLTSLTKIDSSTHMLHLLQIETMSHLVSCKLKRRSKERLLLTVIEIGKQTRRIERNNI